MTHPESTATTPQTPEPDDRAALDGARPEARWWRDAVVYQVYVRSFADANGDGVGDLAGVRDRLPYLRDLGIDALWFNPWYPSPLADWGYDIADYRSIDPAFGTLEQNHPPCEPQAVRVSPTRGEFPNCRARRR